MLYSRGAKDTEVTGFLGVASYYLDWGPSPLPNADPRRAAELDLPAGPFDGYVRPGVGDARRICAAVSQQLGENDNRVVALEGHERGRFSEHPTEGRLDS